MYIVNEYLVYYFLIILELCSFLVLANMTVFLDYLNVFLNMILFIIVIVKGNGNVINKIVNSNFYLLRFLRIFPEFQFIYVSFL